MDEYQIINSHSNYSLKDFVWMCCLGLVFLQFVKVTSPPSYFIMVRGAELQISSYIEGQCVLQRDTQYLPSSLYILVCKRVALFSGVSLERSPGEIGGGEEEDIAKQSDHVLKP